MVPTDDRATSVSPEAARRAPGQVAEADRGDHPAESRPVAPEGSKHWTVPTVARWAAVWSMRSVLTLDATTGPGHSRMAGTASPDVLWDWVGPKTMSDWARSAATSRVPATPSTRRPEAAGAVLARPAPPRGSQAR
jgi:hypothetical protein